MRKKIFIAVVLGIFTHHLSHSQCAPTCGNGVIDAGETNLTCPQDVPHDASCASPCGQPTSFESTLGIRTSYDFVGTTTWTTAGLPAGWTFAGAPTATTAAALPAADAYGAKAGIIQPNCAGSCTATNGFCIGNLANNIAVGAGGTGGKLGANFDGRPNINANLSYAVLRGQSNPTLVSETFNFSAVEGFKIQFWLNASESSCGQTNGWGSCVGNNAFLDFSSNGGTSWTQIMQMNTSSVSTDMCTNNSTNTFWVQEGTWSRVCLTVFKSSASPGNFYPAASGTTAASGMMMSSTWFTSTFKFRIRYSQTASCTSGITTTNPGRYLAIDYPVITSGNQMIPCGLSFAKMCGFGEDDNDDGVGSSTANTNVIAFSTVRRSVNHAERGVEIFSSQNASFAAQNLTGSNTVSNYDLCNAEGGDKQCINWQSNNNFYFATYECVADFETSNINLNYYKGTTAASTTMSKITSAGKTALIGWRYAGWRYVGCGSSSDLNPGCNGYLFRTASLPLQFIRAFYQLATNSLGNSWSFYGPTSCSNYFNGPFFAPQTVTDTLTGSPNFIACNGTNEPVFSGLNKYCSDPSGFSGSGTLTVTGPNSFSEIINSGAIGLTPLLDTGEYVITPAVPSSPAQCLSCAKPICIYITTAMLNVCDPPTSLANGLLSFTATKSKYGVNLRWKTSKEIRCERFELEKSDDGITYNQLYKVDCNGDAELLQHYDFFDEDQVDSKRFYRLKIVNLEGKYTYSNQVRVYGTPEDKVIPVVQYDKENETLLFYYDTKKPESETNATPVSISVYSSTGVKLKEFEGEEKSVYQLPIQLNSGIYIVYLHTTEYNKKIKFLVAE